MKIAVVGVGCVGLVTAACFAECGNNVICVDNDKKKIDKLKQGVIPVYEPGLADITKRNIVAKRLIFTTDLKHAVDDCPVIFLTVGTPSADDGSADISALLHVAGEIAALMSNYRIIATKSTVPVGTHKKVCELMARKTDKTFDYVSNPEFLKQGSAINDFMKPDRVIVGTKNPTVRKFMKQLYAPLMRRSSRMVFMDTPSAEMTKYAANAMLATRLSFMNEISALCSKLDADVEMVRKGIGSDFRIGNAFLFPGVGYGGSCFPKDISALIHMGEKKNTPMTIAKAAQQANYRQQDRFAERILRYFKSRIEQITLGVWGLAFKPNTEDIRRSPAIRCIEKFIDAGIKIKAYDPKAMSKTKDRLDGRICTAPGSYDVLDNADALVIFTDWHEFRTPDFEQIVNRLNKPAIFDGRNLYDPVYVKKQGIEYYSIGRPC